MTLAPSPPLHNQSIPADDDVIANFTARHDTLDTLLRRLGAVGLDDIGQHYILVGARGMGKTSLLRRVAIAINRDQELAAHYVPLTFREEQYNVSSLGDFWRNCGEALAEWAEARGMDDLAARLDAALDSAAWRGDEGPAEQFTTEMTRLERRAVLLVDNIDLILDALPKEEQWTLRRYLQARRGPIMVGAATEVLSQASDHDNAFYEFFQPLHLSPLSARETELCMRALASRRGDAGAHVLQVLDRQPERLKTLHALSGGNPRVLNLTYRLLESEESEAAMADLELLLDQVTPYYKSRVEEYRTAQQRKVIDAIALHWDPITLNTLAETTDIVATTLSPLLNKLRRDGLIEMVETSGSYSAHQLTERFLNIWYLMRHGTRRTKQKMRWLVAFLTSFYSSTELARIARRAAGADGSGDRWHKDYALAFNEALADKRRDSAPDGELASTGEATYQANEVDGDHVALLKKAALQSWRDGEHAQCLDKTNALLAAIEPSQDPKLARDVVIALRLKATALHQLGESEQALAVLDGAITRFGSVSDRVTRFEVSVSLARKAYISNNLGRTSEAVVAYDDIVQRLIDDGRRPARDLSAMAMMNGAIVSSAAGDRSEASERYDATLARFGDDADPSVRRRIAKVWYNKARIHERQGETGAAIDAYGRSAAMSEDGEMAAKALVNRGVLFGLTDDVTAAHASFDAVLALFGDGEGASPELRRQAALALINKAVAFTRLEDSQGEIEALREVDRLFGDDEDPGVRVQVARALAGIGAALWRDDAGQLAIAACDDVVVRFGDSEDPEVLDQVARALLNKGQILMGLGDPVAARRNFDEILGRFEDADEPALQRRVAQAMTNKGVTFGEAGDETAAVKTFDAVIARFGDVDHPSVRFQVANALSNKVVALAVMGDGEGAIAVSLELDARFGSDKAPRIRLLVARGRINRAALQAEAGDIAASVASYEALLDDLSTETDPALRDVAASAQIDLGSIALDILGEKARARALYQAAAEVSPVLSLANLAWLELLADRPDEAARLRQSLDAMPELGLSLLDAGLELSRDNLGLATSHLAQVLGGDLDQGELVFVDDLDRMLRLAARKGYGEPLLAWFEASGFADRLAPIYVAFRAYVRGERTLLDVNLEVRPAAQQIYARLDAARRGSEGPAEGKAKAKPSRGQLAKSKR